MSTRTVRRTIATVTATAALATGVTEAAQARTTTVDPLSAHGNSYQLAEQRSNASPVTTPTARRRLSDPTLCPIDDVSVPESSKGVLATDWLYYGEGVTAVPDINSKIWAGVWLTGENGPAGWTDWPAGEDYPLPGEPAFSLIGKIGNGPWQYIGRHEKDFTNVKPGYVQKVVLRVNDNLPGNGTGAFRVTLRYPCH